MTKEIAASKNIRDRINRHNVTSLLMKIAERVGSKTYPRGVFIYAGINEFGQNVMQILEPKLQCDMFYYNCGAKFCVDLAHKYFETYSGFIVFANGDECLVYEYSNGRFEKRKHLNGNLIKRHKKGGQSSIRFERLAEESRHVYVTRVVDTLNSTTSSQMWLFGSEEICGMIREFKTLKPDLKWGGFIEFNTETINDTMRWLAFLTAPPVGQYDAQYDEIVLYLDTRIGMLDFDPKNSAQMKYCVGGDDGSSTTVQSTSTPVIPLPVFGHKHYSRLGLFKYIGVKYFEYDLDDDCDKDSM